MKVSVASLGKFHAFDLAEQLRQRGMLHRLYTGYPKGYIPEPLTPYVVTFPWIFVPYMAAGRYRQEWLQRATHWASVRTFDRWLARRVASDGCDLLHCWASYGAETTKQYKSLGIPTVCDRGSTHILYQHRMLTEEYRRWGLPPPRLHPKLLYAELEQYRAADAITVPSRIAQASFMGGSNGKEPFVVPYGVDLDRFPWQPFSGQAFRVLFCGALSIRKGIPLVIEAMKKWVARPYRKKHEVWFVGTPLKETAQWFRNIPSHWKVLGAVKQTELPALFHSSTVLLLPSVEEGLALVIGQAVACGLPVVASRETGAEEIVTPGCHGLILKERTVEAIHNALDRIYQNPRHMRTRFVLPQRADLSWNRYGDKMVEHYAILCNGMGQKTPA